ncbi:NADP-dependent oxidoreductase [Cryptosporangium sp. NPDC048952]|uniref:NADP-dependent oxidoreductase n=1 Tax=Cryptosporangium sp. NPDC048952 TaxID=3363961 RepID=UPI00371F40C1
MKAMRYAEYGEPSVLTVTEVERPVPQDGQVLVQVAGAPFNLVDAVIRLGVVQEVFPLTLPATPGIEVSGTVVETGPGADRFALGDAVIGALPMTDDGAAAEYVVVPEAVLALAPTSVPLADASALPVGGLTAWQALFEHADLHSGQRVLVTGAGGSVGGFAVQLAVAAGAHVTATASERSAERVRRYGAHEIVDYTTTPVTGQYDVVLDVVPRSDAAPLGLVAPDGIYVTASAEQPTDAPVRAVRMYLHPDAERLAELVAQVNAGKLQIDVAERLPLSELASVHERGQAWKLPGKVVLIP